jgi:hypothetical protein
MASKKTKPLMGVVEYSATRIGWRGFSVNPSYIYKLIKQYERGEKDAAQIGFTPHPNGKGYLIEPY